MISNSITSKLSQVVGRHISLGVTLMSLVAFLLLSSITSSAWSAIEARPLTDSDCIKCHKQSVEQIITHGGKHNSELSCLECHSDHPPVGEALIPECAECHQADDSAHFKLEACASCHNPHAPLDIDLSAVSPIKPVCVSCHAKPGKQLDQHPSAHTEMDCNECHQQHGEALECLECHSGHSDDMSYNDCLNCHQPHQPLQLQFGNSGVKQQLCGSCHRVQLTQLSNNTSLHAELECIVCHKRTHKVILTCDNCHGEPHDSSIHQQFTHCSKCHKGPHNLRN